MHDPWQSPEVLVYEAAEYCGGDPRRSKPKAKLAPQCLEHSTCRHSGSHAGSRWKGVVMPGGS